MKPFETTRSWLSTGLLLAATAVSPSALLAQDDPTGKPEPTPPTVEHKATTRPRLSIEQWIERLGAEKPEHRRTAEDALLESGAAARSALEAAVEDHEDPEVRWRARRLLRNLDETAGTGRLRKVAPEREFERDSDRGEVAREPAPRPGTRIWSPFEGLEGFQQLEQQMEDLRRQVEEMQRGFAPGSPSLPPQRGRAPFGGGWNFGDNATSLQIGPDGVRLEILEGEGAEAKRKVYEAPDLETFQEKYPEVSKRFLDARGRWNMPGLGPDRFPRIDLPGRLRLLRPDTAAPDAFGLPTPDAAEPPAEGERLGIYVGELAPAVREFLDIDDELGLLVERVEPESLAAELQIQAKDVVLKIGTVDLRSSADVRTALRAIAAGDEVVVTINRRGEELKLRATKRHDAPTKQRLQKVERKEPAEAEGSTQSPPTKKR